MSQQDPNAERKADITARARGCHDPAVMAFVTRVVGTIDLAGGAAGWYLENLESGWAEFARPLEGDATAGLTPQGYQQLHTILFGY